MRTLPTQSPRSRKISLADWVGRAFNSQTQMIDDVHLDQLSHPWGEVRNGMQWLAPCCDALLEVARFVPILENLVGVKKAIVALPLPESQRIKTWNGKYWRLAGVQSEPPSLILVKDDTFDNRYDEEYFRKLELPIGSYPGVYAVFRSYRDLRPEQVEDFGNVIFIIMSIA